MAQPRTRGHRLMLIGGLVSLSGLTGTLLMLLRHRGKRRPTASELMRLDDTEFAEFIRAKGLTTASDLEARTAPTD